MVATRRGTARQADPTLFAAEVLFFITFKTHQLGPRMGQIVLERDQDLNTILSRDLMLL